MLSDGHLYSYNTNRLTMRKIFNCTKEKTFITQLNKKDQLRISEIVILGYLEGKDLMMLSCMSKKGDLRLLDMNGVTELKTDDLEEDGSLDCYPFYFDNHLEEVILPNVNEINYPMFYECKNLKRVELPSTLEQLCDVFLSYCPNIEEIYVPGNLRIDYDGRYYSDYCFVGSGKRFVSDNDEWPEDLEDIPCSFFAFDGILYEVIYKGVSLHRYPAGDERKEFVIPEGVTEIGENAFYGNPYLRSITIPKSVENIEENPFVKCESLETIIFKNEKLEMFSGKDWRYAIDLYPYGIKGIPCLRDIYMYAEKPEDFVFDVFEGLENIDAVTLHVPCFCKKVYRDYEVYFQGYKDGVFYERKDKPYCRFKNIEEFDPNDLFDNVCEKKLI